MARVVAVFLNSILKQKLINQSEIYSDMQRFCIDHSNVKECKNLIQEIIAYKNYNKEINK